MESRQFISPEEEQNLRLLLRMRELAHSELVGAEPGRVVHLSDSDELGFRRHPRYIAGAIARGLGSHGYDHVEPDIDLDRGTAVYDFGVSRLNGSVPFRIVAIEDFYGDPNTPIDWELVLIAEDDFAS